MIMTIVKMKTKYIYWRYRNLTRTYVSSIEAYFDRSPACEESFLKLITNISKETNKPKIFVFFSTLKLVITGKVKFVIGNKIQFIA